MTNSNPGKKRRRITVIATEKGVEKGERALIRLGFESKTNFAKSTLISRYTVSRFFNRHPIQVDSFKRVCEELRLNWEEVIEIEGSNSSVGGFDPPMCPSLIEKSMPNPDILSIIIRDESKKVVKAEITLKGDINSIDNLKIIELLLQHYSGDTIKIKDIRSGSIKLTIEGSQAGIQKLISCIEAGELTKINGFPVENIKVLDKWHLVQEIISQPTQQRNLSGVDLSDTNLSHANLSEANLTNADLSCADLSEANLTNANLSNTDLSEADLTNADLSNANLTETDFSNSVVTGAKFSSDSPGMTEDIKKSLINKGAIFPSLIPVLIKDAGEVIINKLVILRDWLEHKDKPNLISPTDLGFASAYRSRIPDFKATRSQELIQELVETLQTTQDEQERWEVAEMLWNIAPGHPAAGVKEITNLETDFEGLPIGLMVAVLPKSDQTLAILIRVFSSAEKQNLPEGLKLIPLDNMNQPLKELVARTEDAYIQYKLTVNVGEKFGIKVEILEKIYIQSFEF